MLERFDHSGSATNNHRYLQRHQQVEGSWRDHYKNNERLLGDRQIIELERIFRCDTTKERQYNRNRRGGEAAVRKAAGKYFFPLARASEGMKIRDDESATAYEHCYPRNDPLDAKHYIIYT